MAGMLLAGAPGVSAGGAVVLPDRMLDQISAGTAAAVGVVTDSQATGVLAITSTSGNTFLVASPSPYAGQPDLGTTMAVADGTAIAMGSNVSQPGHPAPSASAAVTTDGLAIGNYVSTSTFKTTILGAGGVTAQIGWTVVYGGGHGL